jgi:hypothetical protein
VAKAYLCLLLLAAAVMGPAPAHAACLPVNGLTFEPEPDCNAAAAAVPATLAPVAPAAIAAPPPPRVASAPAPQQVQPSPPAPNREAVATAPSSSLYRVRPGLSDGFLAMRSGPGGQYDMIVRIPSGSDGLNVAECPRSSAWCRVSWKGKTGWVFSRFITRENRGLGRERGRWVIDDIRGTTDGREWSIKQIVRDWE